MRYRPDLPASVSDFSAIIRPREKVGVVGRTGAGKSSSFQMLYRIVEPFQGSIHIDGVDISTIGLHDLRQRALSIIPQAPTLFAGTLRYNLDPFGSSSDDQLWDALEKAQLKLLVEEQGGLDMPISEGGTNLSTGQRQLVCLGRALLRSAQILVCDEISANLDNRSDALLQATIRAEFKSATILTIAHRLLSIIDCDRILVLDKGKIVEFDSPQALIESGGEFASLVEDTGPEMAGLLRGIADGSRSLQEVYDTALAGAPEEDAELDAAGVGGGRDGPRQRQARLAAATLVQAIAQRRDAIWQDELSQTGTPDDVWRSRLYGMVREVATTAQRDAMREKVSLSSLGFSVSGLAAAPSVDAAGASGVRLDTSAPEASGMTGLGDATTGDAMLLGTAGIAGTLGDDDEPLRTRASSTGGVDDLGEAAATISDVLVNAGGERDDDEV
jgi:ABC-type multidrug transport system ATPase subunit